MWGGWLQTSPSVITEHDLGTGIHLVSCKLEECSGGFRVLQLSCFEGSGISLLSTWLFSCCIYHTKQNERKGRILLGWLEGGREGSASDLYAILWILKGKIWIDGVWVPLLETQGGSCIVRCRRSIHPRVLGEFPSVEAHAGEARVVYPSFFVVFCTGNAIVRSLCATCVYFRRREGCWWLGSGLAGYQGPMLRICQRDLVGSPTQQRWPFMVDANFKPISSTLHD